MGVVVLRLTSVGLISLSSIMLSGCEERLSAAEKRLPAAEGQALKQAREYWAGEDVKCALADDCRFKISDAGGSWEVWLSTGEGTELQHFVLTIDKVTREIDKAHWIVQ